jgi:hypothetical protein
MRLCDIFRGTSDNKLGVNGIDGNFLDPNIVLQELETIVYDRT